MAEFRVVDAETFFSVDLAPIIEEYKKCSQVDTADLANLTADFYQKTYKNNDNNRYALVYVENEVVGFIVLELVYQAHFNLTVAEQNTLFILPTYRNKVKGVFKFIQDFARTQGADILSLNAPYGSRLEKVYGRIAKPVCTMFFKTL